MNERGKEKVGRPGAAPAGETEYERLTREGKNLGLVRPTRDPAARPPQARNAGGEYRAKVGVVRKKAGIVGRMGHGARYQGYIALQKGPTQNKKGDADRKNPWGQQGGSNPRRSPFEL